MLWLTDCQGFLGCLLSLFFLPTLLARSPVVAITTGALDGDRIIPLRRTLLGQVSADAVATLGLGWTEFLHVSEFPTFLALLQASFSAEN